MRLRAIAFAFRAAILCAAVCLLAPRPARAQESGAASAPATARSKDGKRLLSTMDALRIHGVTSPRLSPDGTRVAYLASELNAEKETDWKSVTQLWVVPSSEPASSAVQFTRGEKSVSNIEWSSDGKSIAFTTSRGAEEEPQVYMIPADGGEASQVTQHKGGVRGFQFSPDGKSLLLVAQDQPSKDDETRKKDKDDAMVIDHDFKMAHLWLWDLDKKTEKRLTEGDFTVSDPHWSPDGARITYTTNPTPKADDGGKTTLWMLTVASGDKKKLVEGSRPTHTARWSADGKWIAYLGSAAPSGVYQTHLYVVSADGGAPRELTSSFELDAGAPVWSPDGRSIYFTSETHESTEVFAADVSAGAVHQVSQHAGTLNLAELSHNGRFAVGTAGDATHPADVFRSDLAFRTIERITEQNAWLKDYAVGESEIVKWKSKDGLDIEGVLTKPVDFDASKKYPFLLNPHGGPTGASNMSFSPTVQLMAANGYLVLQPNFRGSTGRGEKFAAMNVNDWGGGDYQDCITGVQSIVEKGWADPARLGAFGWSYGGYMTFWILTQTDMFKAVSPGAGLTDIAAMYAQNDIQGYLRFFYGDKPPWDNFQEYWDHSPMKFVKNVKTPAMILQGQVDTRVPIAEAQEFYRALYERGIPVEFIVYPRENHGFTEPRHIRDRLGRYLTFFGKYLNNPPVSEPAPEPKKEKAEQ